MSVQQQQQLLSPQELIYNAALRFGATGARNQILGNLAPAAKCYKRARMLVEAIETGERERLSEGDRAVLADLREGFGGRIREIGRMMGGGLGR